MHYGKQLYLDLVNPNPMKKIVLPASSHVLHQYTKDSWNIVSVVSHILLFRRIILLYLVRAHNVRVRVVPLLLLPLPGRCSGGGGGGRR